MSVGTGAVTLTVGLVDPSLTGVVSSAKTPDDAVASTAVEISEINFALFKVSYLSFLFLAVITDTA